MKYLLLLLLFTIIYSYRASAQKVKNIDSILHKMNQEEPALPTREVVKHINEDVYISDIISDYKIISDTLKILYVGGKYPNQKVTVFVKGKEPNSHVNFKKGEKWHFSGKAFIYCKKPAITIVNSVQFGTRIQI